MDIWLLGREQEIKAGAHEQKIYSKSNKKCNSKKNYLKQGNNGFIVGETS